MRNDNTPRMNLAAGRTDFLDFGAQGIAGVSDLVVASWRRSRAAGVNELAPSSSFTEDFDGDSLLVRSARQVFEQLAVDIADLPITIGLSDKRVRVVRRIDGTPQFARASDCAEYAPGFDFSEATMGTNAAGTVMEAGQPVSLIGRDHFSRHLQPFAATGAPIIDPVTGRIEGVVAIASLAQDWNPLVQTLARNAATDVGRNLLLDRSQGQRAVFDAYLHATARSTRLAVFAFGPTMWIASPAAEQLFDAGEQQLLREHAEFLLAHRDHANDTLLLPGAQRLVRLRGTRITVGAQVAGMLVIAEPATPRQTTAAAGLTFRSHAARAGSRSPAWARACDELREALAAEKPTLLLGESGSGKFTLVTQLLAAVHPGTRRVEVDANALSGAPESPAVHVVRGIDRAALDQIGRLQAYIAAVESVGGWVVATASHSPAADLPFRELLGHFDAAITVPPLRWRTDDLPGIAAALLRELAPGRKVVLSPAAQRLLLRYSWPRNVTELREALGHAVGRRPIGEIQEADLPGYCQTTSRRTLTPLEAVERDAIVTALKERDGNRVAAAAQLGMSRSSLYRKLKAYGITA